MMHLHNHICFRLVSTRVPLRDYQVPPAGSGEMETPSHAVLAVNTVPHRLKKGNILETCSFATHALGLLKLNIIS